MKRLGKPAEPVGTGQVAVIWPPPEIRSSFISQPASDVKPGDEILTPQGDWVRVRLAATFYNPGRTVEVRMWTEDDKCRTAEREEIIQCRVTARHARGVE